MRPVTRYAKSGDVHIAYQVTGSGPLDLVHVPGFVSHLEADWDSPLRARFIERLEAFSRLIRFDKRGTGLSDRGPIPTLEHHPTAGDADAIVDEIEEFLTGVRHGPEPDRVLATVLFTDIGRATERAAALGDRRWREVLEQHHALVRRELNRFRGREIDTAGDGFLATFDGPARAIRCATTIRDAQPRARGSGPVYTPANARPWERRRARRPHRRPGRGGGRPR